jgi:hypothetical protein
MNSAQSQILSNFSAADPNYAAYIQAFQQQMAQKNSTGNTGV